MDSLNLSGNPSPAIQNLDRLIRAAGGLNPTIYADMNPVDLIGRVVSNVPTVGRSEEQSNGMFLLDLGGLRFHWTACQDSLGSCLIFFVTHFIEINGAQLMARFLDELKLGSSKGGFEYGILDGPMYQADPSVCRVLAHGNIG